MISLPSFVSVDYGALRLIHPTLKIIYLSSYFSFLLGGASRDRTDDPLRARQVLSQLSYGPPLFILWWAWIDLNYRPHAYQACALTN